MSDDIIPEAMKDFIKKIGMSRSIDELLETVDDEHRRLGLDKDNDRYR